MAHAYTPGLTVTERVRHRSQRVLPLTGEVLVNVGDVVAAPYIVAQTLMPGDVLPINLANLLAISPGEVPRFMRKKIGDKIAEGELLAQTNGLFGFFKGEYLSNVTGTLESISEITGQVIVRGEPRAVQVAAYQSGTVVEVMPEQGVVVESEVSFIQGIFGVGGEAYGPIRIAVQSAAEELTVDKIDASMAGAIVIGGGRMTGECVKKGIECGVAAIVSGGMDDQDLKEILGYDLGVAVTGSENIGLTLMITEGFGQIAMADRTFELFQLRAGTEAAINGATQIRAGVMRPEVLIPCDDKPSHQNGDVAGDEAGMLEVGRLVRIIRDPYFGEIGTVSALPPELTTLESESKARVLAVQCRNGQNVTIPRANVELIEE